MFAVIRTGGKQYRVAAGDRLEVEKLAGDAGDEVEFDEVLLLGGEQVTVGTPFVDGAVVRARIIDQIRGPKVLTFKRRRRKHSSKRIRGHRQHLTLVEIAEILAAGSKKKTASKAAPKKATTKEQAGVKPEERKKKPARKTSAKKTVGQADSGEAAGPATGADVATGKTAPASAAKASKTKAGKAKGSDADAGSKG